MFHVLIQSMGGGATQSESQSVLLATLQWNTITLIHYTFTFTLPNPNPIYRLTESQCMGNTLDGGWRRSPSLYLSLSLSQKKTHPIKVYVGETLVVGMSHLLKRRIIVSQISIEMWYLYWILFSCSSEDTGSRTHWMSLFDNRWKLFGSTKYLTYSCLWSLGSFIFMNCNIQFMKVVMDKAWGWLDSSFRHHLFKWIAQIVKDQIKSYYAY